jgi:tripartite-type tricarboxylate transporter receptor subunit TctC
MSTPERNVQMNPKVRAKSRWRFSLWPAAALLMCAAVASMPAGAQAYPVKPVKLIIPYAPGGSADFVGRVVAQKLSDAWGQQVLPENRPGANGNIGVEIAAKTAADGYTLLLASELQFVINPAAFPKMRQDMLKEFEPISLVAVAFNVLVANASLPAKNVPELVEYARANPGKINYASPGTASPNHLAMELLGLNTGVKMVHVPYKGVGQAFPDVIAGQVQLMLTTIPPVLPHLNTNRIKVLGVASPTRLQTLPDLPTIAEQGYPGFESSVAWSLFAPAGTPKNVINAVHAEVVKMLGQADMRERLNQTGMTPVGSTPAGLAARLKDDLNKWPKVIREAGIKVEE